MAVAWTSANSPTNSLTQKLRDLGRHKSKSEEKLEKGFEIVHTPDRPTQLISPIEAPTEEECGDEIARLQRTSLRGRDEMFTRHRYEDTDLVGQHSLRYPDGRLEEERKPREGWYDMQASALTSFDEQDGPAVAAESDDEAEVAPQRQLATQVAYVKTVGRRDQDQQTTPKHNQVVSSAVKIQAGSRQAKFTRPLQQQHAATTTMFQNGNIKANYAAGSSSPTPAPLFAGSVSPPSPPRPPRSVSPALATVAGEHSLTAPQYTRGKGRHPHTEDEDEEDPVDTEQLVRMEIYRRGFCPFCRKFFGHDPLPLECPYLDCKRDLRICLAYPNRTEMEKAPPRLAERALLTVRRMAPKGDLRGVARRLADHRAVPSLAVEAPTPIDEPKPARRRIPSSPPPRKRQPRPKSPSPSSTIRTIWPSPSGIYDPARVNQPSTPEPQKYMDKPLPAPPTPPSRSERRPPPPATPPSPPSTLSDSISDRHQQLYKQPQPHIASQLLKTPPPSLSSSTPAAPPPSPRSSGSAASRGTNNTPPSRSPRLLPTSRYRGGGAPPPGTRQEGNNRRAARSSSASSSLRVDDSAFLAWKKPEERARFEREIQEKGDNADLFMDIIGQYGGEEEEEEEEDNGGQRNAVGRTGFF